MGAMLLPCLGALLLLSVSGLCREAPTLQALKVGRSLLEEQSNLKDPTYAFLTKYEEAFNTSSIPTNATAYAIWGWSDADKSIKYAVLGSSAPAYALSAASGADIKFIHLHVGASRGQNSTDKLTLAQPSATLAVVDGYKVYTVGSINDTTVAGWTNSNGLKTASALWDLVEGGSTYTNIHTTAHPDGEARGQNDWNYDDIETVEDQISASIRANDDNWRLAFLTPYEETKAVAGNKSARGFAVYGWDDATKSIAYAVLSGPKASDNLYQVNSYADIKAIHLLVGAPRGADSAHKIALAVPTDAAWKLDNGLKIYATGTIDDVLVQNVTKSNSSPVNGTAAPWATSAADVWQQIKAGQTYTNVHTTANPDGEIRGQNDWDYAGLETLKTSAPNATAPAKSAAFGAKPLASLLLPVAALLLALA